MPDPDPVDASPAGLLAQTRPGDNAEPLTVSELSQSLKRTVEDRFGHVRLRGEISGWKRAASGHAYLCLKDEGAVIDAVMWKAQTAALPFQAQDGLEVIATGRITTYPGRSKYQIVVERLELAGEGALMALYERLRESLAAEGLFDRDRKRALPFLPRVIGVVTSPTGAVIRDILHRLADRCPGQVLVWPVKVQGQGAAAEIAGAIKGFDAIADGGTVPRPDLLIVARGGGSVEDLWAFNEEPVVRAIAACRIPVISAVGHETDTSLSDFAADLRAPTPTAAAEIAVPVRAELQAMLIELRLRTERCARRYHERGRERLQALVRVLPRRDAILGPQRQRLDDLGARLDRGLGERLAGGTRALDRAGAALRPAMLRDRLTRARERLEAQRRLLAAAHPDRPLERGYVQVRDTAGRVVASAAAARDARSVRLRFGDGSLDAQVGEHAGGVAPPPRRVRAKPEPQTPADQGRLL